MTKQTNEQEYIFKLLKYISHPDPETLARIEHGPELYRKGMMRYRLVHADGSPYEGRADVSFRQTGHEFEFGCNGFMFDEFPEEAENESSLFR